VIEVLEVLCQAAAWSEPGETAFDDPAHWRDREALGRVGARHDLNRQPGQCNRRGVLEDRSLVTGVSEQLGQEREPSQQAAQQQTAAIAVLDVSRMHDRMQNQAQRIDQDMPFLAFDLLARVIARPIDRRAPFSVLLTLWLSITQAVGLASRSACSRHAT